MSEILTFKGAAPGDLVLRTVKVRPFYHVPSGRRRTEPTRNRWTVSAQVIAASDAADTVTVVYRYSEDRGPWDTEQVVRVDECHRPECACVACDDDGPGLDAFLGA